MVEKTPGDWDIYGLGSDANPAVERANHEALASWTADLVTPVESPANQLARTSGRARLLATLVSDERFRPFYVELDKYFAIGVENLRAILRKIDDPVNYQDAPMPGVRFFHFAPGASSGFAEAGIVQLAKGASFPRHRHVGDEVNFILEGTLIDAGITYGPGSAVVNAAGSAHAYSAGRSRDLVLVAGHNGITYLGDTLTPPPDQ
jgi:hypothetical protein